MDKLDDSQYSSSDDSSDLEEIHRLYVEDLIIDQEDPYPSKTQLIQKYWYAVDCLKIRRDWKSILRQSLETSRVEDILQQLYWLFICVKFHDKSTQSLQKIYKEKLKKIYAQLLVTRAQPRKEKLFEILPIALGHSLHHEFWEMFKGSRHNIDLRLIYDTYQLVYYEFMGITVTDPFIKNTVLRYFGKQFLSYTQSHQAKKLDDQGNIPKDIKLKMQGVHKGVKFAEELLGLNKSVFEQQTVEKRPQSVQKLPRTMNALQRVVESNQLGHSLSKSLLQSSQPKLFNCAGVSPLLSSNIPQNLPKPSQNRSSAMQRGYSTPHCQYSYKDKLPRSIVLLSQHCEKKYNEERRIQSRQKRDQERQLRLSSQNRLMKNFKLGQGISRSGIEHSPCFQEMLQMRNRLKDFPSAYDLYKKSIK